MKLHEIKQISRFPTTKEKVEAILLKYSIANFTINEDLSVDVEGDVSFCNKAFKQIPVKFRNVTGRFSVLKCKKLLDLTGAPDFVGAEFDATDCEELVSLEGGPVNVIGWYSCGSCYKITSLVGSPKSVGKFFNCSGANIKDFIGGPEILGSGLICNFCKLTSFEGAPRIINGLLECQSELIENGFEEYAEL